MWIQPSYRRTAVFSTRDVELLRKASKTKGKAQRGFTKNVLNRHEKLKLQREQGTKLT